MNSEPKNIILGITGSVAAYKAAEITSLLIKRGISVHVIMTAAAQKFITPLTFQSLTKNKVYVDMFDENYCPDIRHISLAQKASVFCIAPASANIIGKLAAGIADDMLSTVCMAFPPQKPVIICPAMNTAMYENRIVQSNIHLLESIIGMKFIEPKESMLACGDIGKGALADINKIVDAIIDAL